MPGVTRTRLVLPSALALHSILFNAAFYVIPTIQTITQRPTFLTAAVPHSDACARSPERDRRSGCTRNWLAGEA